MKLNLKLVTFSLVFLCFKLTVCSQIWEMNLEMSKISSNGTYLGFNTGELITFDNNVLHYAGSFGLNVPICKFQDELVLGVQGNIDLSFICSTLGGIDSNSPYPKYAFGVPVYITLKYGGGSQEFSKKVFGFGIGMGYLFQSYFCDFSSPNSNDDGSFYFRKPVIMMEIALDRSHKSVIFDNLKLRYEAILSNYSKSYSFENKNYDYSFYQQSLSLVICYKFK